MATTEMPSLGYTLLPCKEMPCMNDNMLFYEMESRYMPEGIMDLLGPPVVALPNEIIESLTESIDVRSILAPAPPPVPVKPEVDVAVSTAEEEVEFEIPIQWLTTGTHEMVSLETPVQGIQSIAQDLTQGQTGGVYEATTEDGRNLRLACSSVDSSHYIILTQDRSTYCVERTASIRVTQKGRRPS